MSERAATIPEPQQDRQAALRPWWRRLACLLFFVLVVLIPTLVEIAHKIAETFGKIAGDQPPLVQVQVVQSQTGMRPPADSPPAGHRPVTAEAGAPSSPKGAGTGQADDCDQAKFAEGTGTLAAGAKFLVKVEVSKELFKTRDVWLGVIPVEAPWSIWMQSARLSTARAERVVYLGLEGRQVMEKFQICICTCKKGAIRRDGEIKLSDADTYGLEILATHTVERWK